jgi:hypothetical protein
MALLYGGGLFSGALADRIGTHRITGAGALLCGGSLVAAGAVGTVWEADVTLGAGFGLGVAICYTPAVAAVQPWFDRNRGIASGIALSGTGPGHGSSASRMVRIGSRPERVSGPRRVPWGMGRTVGHGSSASCRHHTRFRILNSNPSLSYRSLARREGERHS